MLGATAGGFALGTAGTAAAHAIQYPVGALTHTPHGVGVGALLPYVMEFNRPARVPELAAVAVAMGASPRTASAEDLADEAIDRVDRPAGLGGDPRHPGRARAPGRPAAVDGRAGGWGPNGWSPTTRGRSTSTRSSTSCAPPTPATARRCARPCPSPSAGPGRDGRLSR